MKIDTYKELMHLLSLPVPDPRQLRRIAEVAEMLFDDEAARPWWEKAAQAGDQDAVDYLVVLNEEEAAGGHGGRGMSAELLRRDGDSGYTTRSVDAFNLSPVYVTVACARRLLRRGEDVTLPEGYSLDTLGSITWLTGAYGAEVRVSERQGREVAQLARELMTRHAGKLEPAELEGVRRVIAVIIDNMKY